MAAPANEHCGRPFQKSWFQSTVSALKPIHNFAINIARTWIHGSTDLFEVLFKTPLRDFIVIILPVRKSSLPGKSHRVIAHCNGDQAASIFIPEYGVHALGSMIRGSDGLKRKGSANYSWNSR